MRSIFILPSLWVLAVIGPVQSAISAPAGALAFTVSMENPAEHVFHVVFECDGLKGGVQDFKMPVWTPGYYALLNSARYVSNFTAADGLGHDLKWDKTATNAWQVQTGDAGRVVIRYDVRAPRSFTPSSYLDENRAYIMPSSLCLYVGGMLQHPVTLTLLPNPPWTNIATGLNPVSPKTPYTLVAKDFDMLYDSPILMGNLDQFPAFDVRGVHHYFTGYHTGITNRQEWIANLQKVVAVGAAIVGEMPYDHYTFIAIGPGGGGGIEHLNSTSFGFNGTGMGGRAKMNRSLNFLAHEYFHTFNVKRIRPVVLGPFDYDHPVRTRMLWVSEGFTSYYEEIMLRRAGMTTQEELLDAFRNYFARCENSSGHLFQSVTEASYAAWDQGQGTGPRRGGTGISRTISYYDKGPALALLLDFKIRHETRNARSLDTVMRTLYQKFHKEKKRGWTDAEFQQACEQTAGAPLQEVFDYASTTQDIDYDKYLGYAGLQLEPAKESTNAYFGAWLEDQEGRLVVAAAERGSPAMATGLMAGDVINTLDGEKVDAAGLREAVAARKPGDGLKLTLTRAGQDLEIEVPLAHKMQHSYRILAIPNPGPLEVEILKSWNGSP